MSVTSPDFESGAYTNFATPAATCEGKDNKSSRLETATADRVVCLGSSVVGLNLRVHPASTRTHNIVNEVPWSSVASISFASVLMLPCRVQPLNNSSADPR